MSVTKEQAILNGLLYDQDFSTEVLPYVKPEYFESREQQIAFQEISDYSIKYGALPSAEELFVEVEKRKDLDEHTWTSFQELHSSHFKKKYKVQTKWLRDLTEKFCKDRALFLAIQDSIQIYSDNDKKISRDAIPELIREALSISFDNTIGHDYFEDAEAAWEYNNSPESLVKFKLDILNKITGGGVPYQTLNAFMGGTNTFKTGFLCDLAASYLDMGHDVLYVTLEMSEFKIRERIDANLSRLRIPEVKTLLKPMYMKKIGEIKERTQGRLVIKEYPATSANANHFRALFKDLELKKQFKPKILMVDYLSICASIRVRDASNLYAYNKAIAEELRGLAQEYGLILWTGMQTNRGGQDSSDPTFGDTSESHGVPMTLDLLWAIVNTEELESKGLIMIKQLKSRYEDKSKYRRIILGVDRERMTVFEPDKRALEGFELNPEDKVFERKPTGPREKPEVGKKGGFKFND